MLYGPLATRGMASAPHPLAAQAGLAVLREGGNAIEAAVAIAATLAVVAPHRCGLGGDGFWLIHEPGRVPISIDACGVAAAAASPRSYHDRGLHSLPDAGPLAALTVPGAVSGWQAALEIAGRWGGRMALARLFAEAMTYARSGVPVGEPHRLALAARRDRLAVQPGFAQAMLGEQAAAGRLVQPGLATLFERLAAHGLDDFYRGAIGHHLGAALHKLGSPLTSEDLARHRSVRRRPLALPLGGRTVYSLPPPTQGLTALMTVGLAERRALQGRGEAALIHALSEALKQAMLVRNAHITDPTFMTIHSTTYLSEGLLDRMAADLSPAHALPWFCAPQEEEGAWFGVIDGAGRAVSVNQSLGQAFGSGVAVGEFGLLWQERSGGYSLDEGHQNALMPGRKPFQMACPGLVRWDDGRVLVLGCNGGDVQPLTQAAIQARLHVQGGSLQAAVSAPRWRLGSSGLLAEDRLPATVLDSLRDAGHSLTLTAALDPRMGQGGALLRHADGLIEGAADPRGDGAVLAF